MDGKTKSVGVGFSQPVGLRAGEPRPYNGYRTANCAAFSPRGATYGIRLNHGLKRILRIARIKNKDTTPPLNS